MTLLVIVVTYGLAQVLIFSLRWPIAVTIILSQGLGRVDANCQGEVLRPGAAGAAIKTIFVPPTLLMVLTLFFWDLRMLGTMRKHGLCFLRAEQKGVLVLDVIFGRFLGRAMALGTASIHFTGPQKKVQGALDLSRDSLFNCLVPNVFSTTFLFGLGADGWP